MTKEAKGDVFDGLGRPALYSVGIGAASEYAELTPGADHPDVFERLLTRVSDVRDAIELRELRARPNRARLAHVLDREQTFRPMGIARPNVVPKVAAAIRAVLAREAAARAAAAAGVTEISPPVTEIPSPCVTVNDTVTEMNRGRGRPKSGNALTPAQKMAAHRARKAAERGEA